MKKLILSGIMIWVIVSAANAAPGIATKQHAVGSEVNLGTIVFEKYSKKMGYRYMRPQGLDLAQISSLSSEIAFGSCLSAQVAEEIVKTFDGRTLSEADLDHIVESKLPRVDQVFVWKNKSTQMTEESLLQEIGMKAMIELGRKNKLTAGEQRYQAALQKLNEPEEIEAPKTIEEARQIVNYQMNKNFHKNEVNVLNALGQNMADEPKNDKTGFLKGVFKSRFENTYFNIGKIDDKRMIAGVGAIGQVTISGGLTSYDPTMAYYTKGSIHAQGNGDFEMSALNCMLSAKGDTIRLICPSSTGEIYNGGGEGGIYCGTKTTVTKNASGQFQILKPNL